MNTKKITFLNAGGERLAARLELPEEGQPLAFALFAHCFSCSKDFKAVVNISRSLSTSGIAVLRFDFTGLGESEGDFSAQSFSSEVSDLVDAARFLEKEYAAPRLLIGHSLGGMAVLAAAADIPSTTAIVTISAPFNPAHLRELLGESAKKIDQDGQAAVRFGGREFVIRKSLLDDLAVQQPAETLRRLNAALLVLHSTADEVVGIENAVGIFQAASHPKSFVSLDSADHLLSDSRDSRYAGRIIAAWASRYLAPLDELDPHNIPSEVIDNRVTARTGAEGFRTDIFVNGFRLVADEPLEYGGGNEGPSPYEFLLASLGACTGMTLRMYASGKGWPLEKVVVRLSYRRVHAKDCKDCDESDRRIDEFERELELHGELDEEQRKRLLDIAGHCPVHRTLTGDIRIETTLRQM